LAIISQKHNKLKQHLSQHICHALLTSNPTVVVLRYPLFRLDASVPTTVHFGDAKTRCFVKRFVKWLWHDVWAEASVRGRSNILTVNGGRTAESKWCARWILDNHSNSGSVVICALEPSTAVNEQPCYNNTSVISRTPIEKSVGFNAIVDFFNRTTNCSDKSQVSVKARTGDSAARCINPVSLVC